MKNIKNAAFSIAIIYKCAAVAGAVVMVCLTVKSFLPGLTTWAIRAAIDAIAIGTQGTEIYRIFAITIVGYAVSYLSNTALAVALNAGVFEFSNAYCRRVLSEKISQKKLIDFESNEKLNLQKLARECVENEAVGMIYYRILQVAGVLVSACLVVAVVATENPWLGVCALLSAIPCFLTKMIRGRQMNKVREKNVGLRRACGYYYGLFLNKTTLKDIRMLGAQNYLREKWSSGQKKWNTVLDTEYLKNAKTDCLCEMLNVLGFLCSLLLVVWEVKQGSVPVSSLCACVYAFQSVQASLSEAFDLLGSFPGDLKQVGYFRTFLGEEGNTEPEKKALGTPELEIAIRVENLTFRYPQSEHAAIDNLSAVFPAGKVTAIVGKNGCGKTTISKLLTGQYTADTGKIYWDGQNIAAYAPENIATQVAIIPQPQNKLKYTLAESILLRRVTGEVYPGLKAVLEKVGLEKYATQNCLETMLGKEFGGLELSGGEWQKVSIARCIQKDAKLLILDEPTSALDPIAEAKILQDFIALSRGKTSIIITHRLGICQQVDNIVVMDQGKAVQSGTHEALMKQMGLYRELYESQRKWYVTKEAPADA